MKIDIENSIYPKQLKKLKNPPRFIYANGNIELLKTNRNINNWFKKTNGIRRKNNEKVCKGIKLIWVNDCKWNGRRNR